jgi:hypothetical protein
MGSIRPEAYTSQKGVQRSRGKADILATLQVQEGTRREERVAEPLVYCTKFLDTHAGERGSNGVDGLLATFYDKRLEVSLRVVAKAQASDCCK